MYLLKNITNPTSTSTFSANKCACVIKFLLGKWRKWRPIRDQIFVVVETVFFIVSVDITLILVDQNLL